MARNTRKHMGSDWHVILVQIVFVVLTVGNRHLVLHFMLDLQQSLCTVRNNILSQNIGGVKATTTPSCEAVWI